MRITDEQLAHLRDSFKQYDINGDGQIDKVELGAILHDLKVEDSANEVDRIMSKLDSDGNGSISFGEFLKSLKSIKSLKEVEVDDIVETFTAKAVTPDTKVEEESESQDLTLTQQQQQQDLTLTTQQQQKQEESSSESSNLKFNLKEQSEESESSDLNLTQQKKQEGGEGDASAHAAQAPTPAVAPAARQEVSTSGRILRGSPHTFIWRYEGDKVDLAGDFTSWGAGRLPMRRNKDGHFETEITLTPGVYEYRFIINDQIEWYYDILYPNVLNVGSGFINNYITV